MGVDHNGVGGIGIELTEEIRNKLIEKGLFTQDEWDEDEYGCLETINLPYSVAGDGNYGGDDRYYLLVHGDNLEEIIKNEQEFRNHLQRLGIQLDQKDLIVISDLHVW